jgi:hypothetical protein
VAAANLSGPCNCGGAYVRTPYVDEPASQ